MTCRFVVSVVGAVFLAAGLSCCGQRHEGSFEPVVDQVIGSSGDVTLHVEAVSSAKQFYVAPTPQNLDAGFAKGETDYHLVIADKAAIVGFLDAAPAMDRRSTNGLDYVDYRGEFRVRLSLLSGDGDVLWRAHVTDHGEVLSGDTALFPGQGRDEQWLHRAVSVAGCLLVAAYSECGLDEMILNGRPGRSTADTERR